MTALPQLSFWMICECCDRLYPASPRGVNEYRADHELPDGTAIWPGEPPLRCRQRRQTRRSRRTGA